jgi:hypothetical protein
MKKISNTGCLSLFIEQQGELNHVFQDPFVSLLKLSEQEFLGIYLGIISEHDSSERMSFKAEVKLLFVLSSQRPFGGTIIQRVQTMNKILTWLHWIFDFT